MACVGLITFAEMGSSHSLHYVLYSEDDSFLCACVCVCMRVMVHLLFSFLHVVRAWRWSLPPVHASTCPCVFFSNSVCYRHDFMYAPVCFCVWEWVTETCVHAKEGEIDSVTQFVCVSHWSQGRSGQSTGSTWSQADDLPRGGYTLMINLHPVLSLYCTDLRRICDALHWLTLRRRTLYFEF